HIAAAGMGSRIVGAELLRAGAHRRDGRRRGRRIAPARPVRHSVADRHIVGAADRRNAVSLWLAPAAASPVGVPGHTAAAAVGRARLDPCLGRSRAAGGQPPPGARTHQPQTLAHGLAPAIPYAFRLGVSPVIAGIRQRALEQLHPGRYGLLDVAAAGAAPVGHRAGAGLDTRAARLWRGGSSARGLQCGAHVAYFAGAGGGLRRGQPGFSAHARGRGAATDLRRLPGQLAYASPYIAVAAAVLMTPSRKSRSTRWRSRALGSPQPPPPDEAIMIRHGGSWRTPY